LYISNKELDSQITFFQGTAQSCSFLLPLYGSLRFKLPVGHNWASANKILMFITTMELDSPKNSKHDNT
jgi:hypothetical protein